MRKFGLVAIHRQTQKVDRWFHPTPTGVAGNDQTLLKWLRLSATCDMLNKANIIINHWINRRRRRSAFCSWPEKYTRKATVTPCRVVVLTDICSVCTSSLSISALTLHSLRKYSLNPGDSPPVRWINSLVDIVLLSYIQVSFFHHYHLTSPECNP